MEFDNITRSELQALADKFPGFGTVPANLTGLINSLCKVIVNRQPGYFASYADFLAFNFKDDYLKVPGAIIPVYIACKKYGNNYQQLWEDFSKQHSTQPWFTRKSYLAEDVNLVERKSQEDSGLISQVYALSGKFTSFFQSKRVPVPTDDPLTLLLENCRQCYLYGLLKVLEKEYQSLEKGYKSTCELFSATSQSTIGYYTAGFTSGVTEAYHYFTNSQQGLENNASALLCYGDMKMRESSKQFDEMNKLKSEMLRVDRLINEYKAMVCNTDYETGLSVSQFVSL